MAISENYPYSCSKGCAVVIWRVGVNFHSLSLSFSTACNKCNSLRTLNIPPLFEKNLLIFTIIKIENPFLSLLRSEFLFSFYFRFFHQSWFSTVEWKCVEILSFEFLLKILWTFINRLRIGIFCEKLYCEIFKEKLFIEIFREICGKF
jgi:hypothetical protein